MDILEKKDFTLSDLIEFTKYADYDTPIYESCFTKDYTIKQMNAVALFEKIYAIYNEKHEIITVADFDNKNEALNLEYLREFAKNNTEALHLALNRDVEDGYVFSNFDMAILTDKKLVLL